MIGEVFILCDEDRSYAARFSDYITRQTGGRFQVQAFTRPDRLETYLNGHFGDLAVLSEDFYEGLSEGVRGRLPEGYVFLLSKEKEQASAEGRTLYRYQSAKTILERVLKQYDRGNDIVDKTFTAGVYSPVRRCGRTTFSAALAEALAERGSVLLLTLEDNCGHSIFRKEAGEPGLSDLLYEYAVGKTIRENLSDVGHLCGNVRILGAADCGEDIRCSESGRIAALITALAEKNVSSIVVDVGDALADVTAVLEVCDLILVPTLEDEVAQNKLDAFIESIRCSGGLRRKLRLIRLPEEEKPVAGGICGPALRDYAKCLFAELSGRAD